MDADDGELVAALELSQQLGMLGSRPVAEVIGQAEAFVAALDSVLHDPLDIAAEQSPAGAGRSVLVADLGSGGGVPGLVIAWHRRQLDLALVERRITRADHLRRLVARLRLDRVEVLAVDADVLVAALGRTASALVARGFGPPAELLAVAAPALDPGGALIVSEPPDLSTPSGTDPAGWRGWDEAALAEQGFTRRAHADRRVAILQRR